MSEELELYLDDLNEEAKRRVLEFLGVERPEDLNLDVLPLTIIPKPEERLKNQHSTS